jgi:hypothetical protein
MEKDSIMKTFMVYKDYKILRVYETTQDIEGIELSMQNENLIGTIIEVPNLFEGIMGQDIREFTKDWKFKPLKDRVQYMTIPEDEIYDQISDVIRKKILKERIESGLEVLNPEMKLNTEGTMQIPKTWAEMISDKTKTYENWLTQVVRPYRDYLLSQIDIIHCNPERWWAYTEEQKNAWSIHKQALRDFPVQELEVTNDVELLSWPRRPE